MPQVPYSPIPDVRPTSQGTPALEPRAPAAAFGTNVAEAIGSVGGDLEKAGGEIFTRAMAMQDLNNRADADKAVTDYVVQMGLKHADFSAKQGRDAVNAFPDYMKDIQQLREQFGTNLNPMARKLYDTESRGQMARTIFNGAGHAATQNKQWLIENGNAQIDLAAKTASDDPNSDQLYEQQVQRAKDSATYVASLHGFGPDTPFAQDKTQKAVSQITLTRILTMARTEPTKAMELYKQLEGNLNGPDKIHAETAVWGQTRSVGSANIAQKIFSEGFDDQGKQTVSIQDMIDKGKQEADKLMPGDTVLQKAVEQNIRIMNTRKIQTDKLGDWEADQQIRDIIQAHPEITTEQQLRALPEARQILDGLNFKGRGIDTPGYIHRYLESKFKEVNDEKFYQLKAIASRNRDQFLDIDFTKEGLDQKHIDILNGIRKQLIKKPDDDPKLRNALTWMRGAHGAELQALGIFNRDRNNPEDFDKYAGTMLQAIEAWSAANNNKTPGFKDITEEIGPQIIKQNVTKGWLWDSQTPTFKLEPPDDFINKVQKKFPQRTVEDIQKDYTAFMFQKLFGATVSPEEVPGARSKTTGDQAVTNKPEVPFSQ